MTTSGAQIMFSGQKFNDIVQLIPVELFLHDEEQRFNEIKNSQYLSTLRFMDMEKYKKMLGLNSLSTVMVPHIQFSYGICLDMKAEETQAEGKPVKVGSGSFKLVYSGDCRPSDSLIEAGKNCDLLIHECTFDNANHDKAVYHRHSTIGEALEVSRKMNAKHTLLSHFSQRYSKFVLTNEMDLENCGFAFDFMSLTPENMSLLSQETITKLNVIFKEKMLRYENSVKEKRIRMNSSQNF